MKDFPAARDAVAVWKPDPLRDYCVALLRAGFAERAAGRPCFGSDNVPDADLPQDLDSRHSIPGSACAMLRNAGCIASFRGTVPELGVFGGMRKSARADRNGARVQTYQLIVQVADEYLARNDKGWSRPQMEMALGIKQEGVA